MGRREGGAQAIAKRSRTAVVATALISVATLAKATVNADAQVYGLNGTTDVTVQIEGPGRVFGSGGLGNGTIDCTSDAPPGLVSPGSGRCATRFESSSFPLSALFRSGRSFTEWKGGNCEGRTHPTCFLFGHSGGPCPTPSQPPPFRRCVTVTARFASPEHPTGPAPRPPDRGIEVSLKVFGEGRVRNFALRGAECTSRVGTPANRLGNTCQFPLDDADPPLPARLFRAVPLERARYDDVPPARLFDHWSGQVCDGRRMSLCTVPRRAGQVCPGFVFRRCVQVEAHFSDFAVAPRLGPADQGIGTPSGSACKAPGGPIGSGIKTLTGHGHWDMVASGEARSLHGLVLESFVATDDLFLDHNALDQNFFVFPDPEHWSIAGRGNFGGEGFERGVVEVEWEKRNARHPRGFPSWAWPAPGDRVQVTGAWVWDCGHQPVRSEIHPPSIVVTHRNFRTPGDRLFGKASARIGGWRTFDENGGEPTAAVRTDVFASSATGGVITNTTGLPPPPLNSRNAEFDIPAPPRPHPAAQLVNRAIDRGSSNSVAEPSLTPLPGGGGYHVTLPLHGAPLTGGLVVAKTIYVGWAGAADVVPRVGPAVRRYRVTVERIRVRRSLDLDDTGRYAVYAHVNEQADQVLTGAYESALGERYAHVEEGKSRPINRSFDVSLVPGQPLRIMFKGTEHDYESPNEDAGEAEDVWTGDDAGWANRAHTAISGADTVAGDVPQDSDCSYGGCFEVRYRIDRLPAL